MQNTRNIMSYKNYKLILCILVAKNIGPIFVQPNDTSNESLEKLFENTDFPKSGDIPMLNRKVFRGTRVTIVEHPYVVSVRRHTAHYLTGTLLTKNLVITVAHPLYQVCPSELGVVVGESYADRGTMLLTVVLLLFHEEFDPYTLTADLVLLRIYEDINYRVSVKHISLASSISMLNGDTAFVTGWGRCDRLGTELCLPRSARFFRREKLDPMLRTIKFTLTPSEHCVAYYQHDLNIDSRMLCAGPARVDDILCPCMAVPGAPLVVDGQLAGIQSWGFGCGYVRDMPVVYTNLQGYLTWLLRNIPIFKSITKQNLTSLYHATKVNKMINWLNKSRVQLKVPKKLRYNRDIVALEIDKKLSTLRGLMYDIRDFIYDGNFHLQKLSLYQGFKQTNLKQKLLIEEIKMSNDQKVAGVPFLSKGALDESGLVFSNGTLSDNESSDESEDESDDEEIPNTFSERVPVSKSSSYDFDTVENSQETLPTESDIMSS